MFRRLPGSLPGEPNVKPDLQTLGYYINEKDQVRMVDFPAERFRFKVHRREGVNQLFEEALHECMRQEVLSRLHGLGFRSVRLPLGAAPLAPHIPILVSSNLFDAKHVLVLFGERNQDLGMTAYRLIIGDRGLDAGSVTGFVKAIKAKTMSSGMLETPAVVIANPGQLIWCRHQGRAVSRSTWENTRKLSSVHPVRKLDARPGANLVEGNENESEHVRFIFEHVLSVLCSKSSSIDVIAAEWTGAAVVKYLRENWYSWSLRMNSLVLLAPLHGASDILPKDQALAIEEHLKYEHSSNTALPFAQFMAARCRAYILHEEPLGTLIQDDDRFGCNVYSSGEQRYTDCILDQAQDHMIDWILHLQSDEKDIEGRKGFVKMRDSNELKAVPG